MEEKLGEMSDGFIAIIRGNGESVLVTIPIRMVEFMGWKEGDELRLTAQKVLKKEE